MLAVMTAPVTLEKIERLRAMLDGVDDDHDRAAIAALIWELQVRQTEAAGKSWAVSALR
jgi:hypothetical protein